MDKLTDFHKNSIPIVARRKKAQTANLVFCPTGANGIDVDLFASVTIERL